MPIKKLKEYLDANGVVREHHHSKAYTAQEVATSARLGQIMAKTVIVELDGAMAMAVLPANRKIVPRTTRDHRVGPESNSSEEQFQARFPDCETGACRLSARFTAWMFMADSLAKTRRSRSTPARTSRLSSCV
jgi:Ala-tRNA(Pro) deacylase